MAEYDPEAAAKLVGTWAYAPADPAAGVNIRTVRTRAGDVPNVERSPERGAVEITGADGDRIIARTDDGCAWSLVARGNTAKLDPPIQTCTPATSTAITIESLTITTDGTRQISVMTGTDEHGADFVLTEGNLSKRDRARSGGALTSPRPGRRGRVRGRPSRSRARSAPGGARTRAEPGGAQEG